MVGIDLKGKNAIVTGVSDDGGFGWAIAKALQAAGANVHLACHPRVVNIVSMFMRRPGTAESRKLPYGVEGELKPASIIACDVQYDTLADIPEDVRSTKAYEGDASVRGMIEKYKELTGSAPIDILVHSVAFSPEIQKTHLETSRGAYLTAASVGAYSLIALVREALPLMDGRSASVVGITYAASERVVPGYGGGMASAKAALGERRALPGALRRQARRARQRGEPGAVPVARCALHRRHPDHAGRGRRQEPAGPLDHRRERGPTRCCFFVLVDGGRHHRREHPHRQRPPRDGVTA
jgi:enoyl-[acyl-carrier-protein] reductase (NADH)